ncbi:MAG: hypothetical protein U0269_14635 [Polyangiales bacterium]
MRAIRELPAWVIDDEQSVREECADYVAMPPEEKMRLLAELLRDAARILAARSDAQRALDWVDPLPESSLRALARLRSEAKERG